MSVEAIKKISKRYYTGKVYNLEVEPNDSVEDDQYYVCADTGIVVHNCHPRDNIALRWLAKQYNLGYDLFDAIMYAREIQAENMADALMQYAAEAGNVPIIIVGKAYKPLVEYTAGSSTMLVGHYIEAAGCTLYYLDEVIGEYPPNEVLNSPAVYLLGHNPKITYGEQLEEVPGWYNNRKITHADQALTVATGNGTQLHFAPGSIVVDPWRTTPPVQDVRVVHYGNTRVDSLR